MRIVSIVPIIAIAAATPAAAQDVVYRFEQRNGPGHEAVFMLPAPPPGAGDPAIPRMGLLSVEPFEMANTVTGVPYTAEAVTEVVQRLPDGNRIERRTTSTVARDGQGRVRREQYLAAIGPILPPGQERLVTITNPVDGVHYSLDAARKVAMRAPLPAVKPFAAVERGDVLMAAGAARHFETRIPLRAPDDGRTESLGTANIEGVEAQGTRTTVTIPAGAIGNLAPIDVVSERWFSPELGVVVLSRRSDPRFGDTTYRLENITRGEPSPDLFQVPPHYTVETVQPFGAGGFIGKPALPR